MWVLIWQIAPQSIGVMFIYIRDFEGEINGRNNYRNTRRWNWPRSHN